MKSGLLRRAAAVDGRAKNAAWMPCQRPESRAAVRLSRARSVLLRDPVEEDGVWLLDTHDSIHRRHRTKPLHLCVYSVQEWKQIASCLFLDNFGPKRSIGNHHCCRFSSLQACSMSRSSLCKMSSPRRCMRFN